ncbi:MAG TPA: hypothetical protein VNR42_11450 [Solirubrobacteraceae bacterium]|nr:hypothetical protein [Solirubrobacteraceae bacterium]
MRRKRHAARSTGVDIKIEDSTLRIGNTLVNLKQIARVFPYEKPVGFRGGLLKAIWEMVGVLVLRRPDGTAWGALTTTPMVRMIRDSVLLDFM